MARIVVGVDGSPGSRAALAFALEEARLRAAEVAVVHVYRATPPVDPPHTEAFDIGLAVPAGFDRAPAPPDETARRAAMLRREEEYRRERSRVEADVGPARELVEAMVRDAGCAGDVEATPLVIADAHPAEALIESAADAELLVVGSRGRGGFSGLLLGSVSQQCVTHARCPVIVVPSPEEA